MEAVNKIEKHLRDRVSAEEWEARVNLAACYRLMDMFDMTELISNHVSLRVPGAANEFLINPYGPLYRQPTRSSKRPGARISRVSGAGWGCSNGLPCCRSWTGPTLRTRVERGDSSEVS